MPKFNVDTKIEHDGKEFLPGDSIELSKKQAEPLLEINAISSDKDDQPMFSQEQILEAIGSLDVENATLFTSKNVPTTEALADVLGGPVTAKERNDAWAVFNQK